MANAKKTTALAPATPAPLAEFNPRDPQTLLATAAQLAQFVTDNKLASNIQGRSYVQAEGWQFLFAVAGLDVLCAKPARLERATEVCYEAEARLFDANGREVGYGYAICSDSERLKKGWAEYAIASMAQTRAIGKAGRNRFAFVMKAAGFEPTPAEEMSEVTTSASIVAETPAKSAAGNAPAAAASMSPAPSTTSDQSIAGPAEIPAEVLDKYTRQIEASTSLLDLQTMWKRLTKHEAATLLPVKEKAKLRLEAGVAQAAAEASRNNPGVMKVAGADADLVEEFVSQPVAANPASEPVEYATAQQNEEITRLLNHPTITRREKTKLLLNINKLDRTRAGQAIVKLREAIAEREGTDPRDGVRAQLRSLVAREGAKLPADYAAQLLGVAENPVVELAELVDIHEQVTDWLINEETYGTEAELAAAEDEAPIAAAA